MRVGMCMDTCINMCHNYIGHKYIVLAYIVMDTCINMCMHVWDPQGHVHRQVRTCVSTGVDMCIDMYGTYAKAPMTF